MDRVVKFFRIFLISACLVQVQVMVNGQAGNCAFDTDVLGSVVMTREETQYLTFPVIIGTYDALEPMDGIGLVDIEPHDAEYLSFQFNRVGNGQLVVTLKKSLEHSLNAGINILEAIVPLICSGGVPSQWQLAFQVSIKDVNNKPPVFNQDAFNFNVETPWPVSVPINFNKEIIVNDHDFLESNAVTTFHTSDTRIKVIGTQLPVSRDSPKHGYSLQLLLVEPLILNDDTFSFVITAANTVPSVTASSYEDTARVTLTLSKTNVYPPQFLQPVYRTPQPLTGIPPPGAPVLLDNNIQAVDPEGSHFYYYIQPQSPQAHFVTIHEVTGELRFSQLVTEDIKRLDNFVAVIEIVAEDLDLKLSSSATVFIYFEFPDGNAPLVHPPIFSQPLYKNEYPIEGTPVPGSPVPLDNSIAVTNGVVKYRVVAEPAGFVTIHPTTGVLSFGKIVDYDIRALPNGVATVEVIATNNELPPQESSVAVLIYFEIPEIVCLPRVDPPIFSQPLYKNANPIEGIPVAGSPVPLNNRIEVINGVVQYRVVVEPAGLVTIDEITGMLTFGSIGVDAIKALPNGVATVEVIALDVATNLKSSAIVLIYFVVTDGEGGPGQQVETECTFRTDGPSGFVSMYLDEDAYTTFPSILATYDALARMEGIDIEMDHTGSLDFQFNPTNGQLVVTLMRSLEDALDKGNDMLTAMVTPYCVDRSLPVWPVYFQLNIRDINNKPPVFNQHEYNFNVETPWPIRVPVNFGMEIIVTDADFLEINSDTIFGVSDSRVTVTSTRLPVSYATPKYAYALQLFLADRLLRDVNTLSFDLKATNGHLHDTAHVSLHIVRPNICPAESTVLQQLIVST